MFCHPENAPSSIFVREDSEFPYSTITKPVLQPHCKLVCPSVTSNSPCLVYARCVQFLLSISIIINFLCIHGTRFFLGVEVLGVGFLPRVKLGPACMLTSLD